jgi:hypothetical protein
MRIGLDEIDPRIAEVIIDRLSAPLNEFLRDNIRWGAFQALPISWEVKGGSVKVKRRRDPNDDERLAYALRRRRDEQVSVRALGAAFLPSVAGTVVGWAIAGGTPVGGLVTGLSVWAAGTGVGVWWTRQATPRERLRQSVQLEELRCVLPLLSLTRAERVYCDALLLLARTDATEEAEKTLRSTLRQLNDLVVSSRQLEQRRATLLPLLGQHSITELETEFQALGRRLDQATDNITRTMIQQSLQMCATRIENARAFSQGLERLNAQQEAIVHTLSSALSAMARLQILSDPQTEVAAQEIARSVASMSQQTRSVEQAVEEVMSLRSQ